MTTLAEMLRRFEAIDLDVLTAKAMQENAGKIVYLNQRQLLSGIRSDGVGLGVYRPETIAIRREKGRQTNHVDLFFEGDFQGDMYLETNGSTYTLGSKNWKEDKLSDKYGDSIFGLTQSNKQSTWNTCVPYVVREIGQITGAKI